MAGEVSFKAYLSKESEEKEEVRRFSLDPSVATSFIYLKEKLRSLFTPLVLAQSFDIFWKDSDGDYVTICSDEELTIALTESRNEEVIKVYIRNSKGAPTPVNTTKGVNHDNVFCDGCEGPISGYRYKCLGCRDYDLCATCEARGVHSEHFTLRIPAPLNVRHPFGHRLINKISKAARRAESRCPWNHRYEHNLAADMNNCTTEEATRPQCFRPSSAGARRGSSQSCVDPKECGKTCGTSQDSQATASASITLDPAHIPNLVFNTLADFGIDLASFFPAPPTQPGTSSNQQNTEPKKKAPEANTASTSAAGATTTAPPATAATTTTTGPQTTAPPATNAADSKKGSKRNSLSDEWTLYNPNEAQETVTPAPQPIEIDLEMEISPPTSVVAEPMEVTNKPTKAQEAATSTNLYPNLPTLPKNNKVADALDQMLAMGFRNDDGWLTELLNQQDGNIAKVLDLIQSKAQGKN